MASILRQQRMAITQPFPNGAAFDEHNRTPHVPRCRPLNEIRGWWETSERYFWKTCTCKNHKQSLGKQATTAAHIDSAACIGSQQVFCRRPTRRRKSDGMPNLTIRVGWNLELPAIFNQILKPILLDMHLCIGRGGAKQRLRPDVWGDWRKRTARKRAGFV